MSWIKRHREGILIALGTLTATAVAAVTGTASWNHIVHVGQMVGEPSAAWLPVAIDGMVITGTVMAAVDRLRGYRTRAWATVALWWGAILTLFFNVASAWERGPAAMAIAVLFASAFIVSIETMFRPSTKLIADRLERKAAAEAAKTTDTPTVDVAPVTPEAPKSETPAKPAKAAPGRRGRRPGVQQAPTKRSAPRQSPVNLPGRGAEGKAAGGQDVIVATVVEDPAPEVVTDAIGAAPVPVEPAMVAPSPADSDMVRS